MSSLDLPQMFGLNENVESLYNRKLCDQVLHTFRLVLPKISTEHAFLHQRASVQKVLREVHDALARPLPLPTKQEPLGVDFQHLIDQFALSEIERVEALCGFLNQSVKEFSLALEGQILMSELQEQMFDQLYEGRVPAHWVEHSYPTMKPILSWIRDLAQRLEFFDNWAREGRPAALRLSCFFFP